MSAGPENGQKDKLAELDRRIKRVREAGKPGKRNDRSDATAVSYAWRMVIELVVSITVGAAMGWGLDVLLGTLPLFLVVFVLLGFAAGVRTLMRTAAEMQRRRSPRPDEREEG